MAFTTASLVQVLAAATIPLIFLGILASRAMARRAVKWKQVRMMTVLMLAPAVVIFGVRGLLSKWMALASAAIVVISALLLGSGGD